MEVSHHPEIKRLVRIPLAGLTSYITDGPGSGRPVSPKLFAAGFSLAGAWDLNHRPIFPDYHDARSVNAVNFRSTFQFLRDGRAPHETDEYRRNVRKGITRYASAAQYAASLRALHERIAQEGYRSQIELGAGRTLRAASGGWLSYDEKGVVIDRAGRIHMLHANANHRLAIAFLLELPGIWVQIHAIHEATLRRWVTAHGGPVLQAVNAGIAAEIGPNF